MGGTWAEANFQEVLALRERGWEGLPPPPIFTTGKPTLTGVNHIDPAATPVVTSLGLPNRDPEPQIPRSPLESVTVPEADTFSISPATPVTQSPSISIATLSDFTIPDTSDDEPPTDPTITDTSDDEHPADPVDATHMRSSTSTTVTWKCCAGTRSSVSTPVPCPSALPRFAGC